MLPQDKQIFLGHIRRLQSKTVRIGPVVAARTVRSALVLVLESRYPRLADLGLRFDRGLAAQAGIRQFADWLQGLEFLDCAFWLSSAYACLLSRKRRRRQALFFTPPRLSTRLISSLRERGVRIAKARFVDPACGGSAFLAPIAIEIARELSETRWSSDRIVAHVEGHVSGFELDEFLCELSGAFLNMALYEHVCRAGRILKPRIVRGDALTTALRFTGHFDVVVSNPPYRKLTAKEFASLPQTYQPLVRGQPNVYALFIALSLRLTTTGGSLGLLTPAGFFGGRSFGLLRELLGKHAALRQVDFIEPRTGTFLDVEQETALTVFHKGANRAAPTTVFVTNDGAQFTFLGDYSQSPTGDASWVFPRSAEDIAAMQAFRAPQWSLARYGYKVMTGFLVPHRMPVPLLKSKGNKLAVCPLIWATQIGKDGVHRLRVARREHVHLFVDVSGYGADQVMTTPSIAVQRTSSKDQHRRVRCAPIRQKFLNEHGGYMGENHVCFIVPSSEQQLAVSVEVLAKIMNSSAVNRVFRCLSGTATVSAYELLAMPLPDPETVKRELSAGATPDEAAERGYSSAISVSTRGNRKAA
jgi:adenine-specific DNA-methyltransferase